MPGQKKKEKLEKSQTLVNIDHSAFADVSTCFYNLKGFQNPLAPPTKIKLNYMRRSSILQTYLTRLTIIRVTACLMPLLYNKIHLSCRKETVQEAHNKAVGVPKREIQSDHVIAGIGSAHWHTDRKEGQHGSQSHDHPRVWS